MSILSINQRLSLVFINKVKLKARQDVLEAFNEKSIVLLLWLLLLSCSSIVVLIKHIFFFKFLHNFYGSLQLWRCYCTRSLIGNFRNFCKYDEIPTENCITFLFPIGFFLQVIVCTFCSIVFLCLVNSSSFFILLVSVSSLF